MHARIDGLRERAGRRLPAHVFAYIDAVAGTAAERDEALADWDAVRFRPFALRGESGGDLATRVLGTPVRHPVLVAPMAQQVAAHPDGEAETAAGVARSGSP